ncbi:MAG: spore coat protein CotJB [Clostridia bacterium]|nr:spore coat protein CotJB [Clostridia bacterium]
MNNEEYKCNDNLKEEMLMQIRELKFAVVELAEYLDTKPDDRRALYLHNEYARKLRDLEDKYQKMFGPLTIYCPCNKWRWLEEPWPWEGGNY